MNSKMISNFLLVGFENRWRISSNFSTIILRSSLINSLNKLPVCSSTTVKAIERGDADVWWRKSIKRRMLNGVKLKYHQTQLKKAKQTKIKTKTQANKTLMLENYLNWRNIIKTKLSLLHLAFTALHEQWSRDEGKSLICWSNTRIFVCVFTRNAVNVSKIYYDYLPKSLTCSNRWKLSETRLENSSIY